MEPYRPNEPFIKLKLDGSLLDRMVEYGIPLTRAIQYFRDNPEGSAMETLKLAAEDVIPFYGNYRNDGDWSDYAKEAVMLGVPLPYVKHPKTGKQIPNNLKEGWGESRWNSALSNWKYNRPYAAKLYASPDIMKRTRTALNADEVISSTGRIDATRDLVEQPISTTTYGPSRGGTAASLSSEGHQMMNQNTESYRARNTKRKMSGANLYKGDMYSPLRKPADDMSYGPWRTEASKADKPLRDNLYKHEDKWQYYVDDALGRGSTPERAAEMADAAISMGRPDIADKIRNNQKSGRTKANYSPYASYADAKGRTFEGNTINQMDFYNRQIEKQLREQFAMTPDELKPELTQRYGLYDLLEDYTNNPVIWNEYKQEVIKKRKARSSTIRTRDNKYRPDVQR